MTDETTSAPRERVRSIDALRGIVMILMALDHVRFFLSKDRFPPTDLEYTTVALFLTRWVTHFCAPVFLFLVGVGAYLYGQRHGAQRLRRFLWTRGLWLVVLELTVVRFGWFFNVDYHLIFAGVIWMIGVCMLVTAAVASLPTRVIGGLGLVIVCGHDLLSPIDPSDFGALSWVWVLLHDGGRLQPVEGVRVTVLFSLLPWLGLLWTGLACGPVFELPAERRRRTLLLIGGLVTVAFVALRGLRLYGDPVPWESQPSTSLTVLAFLNTNKYPASLQFLLMTIGPALLVLPLLEAKSRITDVLSVFGRVPLMYYALHLIVIHALAILLSLASRGLVIEWLRVNWGRARLPDDYGYALGYVYLAWFAVVALLYWPCRRFAAIKATSRARWLQYL